jgi:hypothetical protein
MYSSEAAAASVCRIEEQLQDGWYREMRSKRKERGGGWGDSVTCVWLGGWCCSRGDWASPLSASMAAAPELLLLPPPPQEGEVASTALAGSSKSREEGKERDQAHVLSPS